MSGGADSAQSLVYCGSCFIISFTTIGSIQEANMLPTVLLDPDTEDFIDV